MISACTLTLQDLFSGIRLQLLMSCSIGDKNCEEWADGITKDKKLSVFLPEVQPILKKIYVDPIFAVNLVKKNTITSSLLAFTSSVEFYLQDLVSLCMKRNSGLRSKSFSDYKIKALELETEHSIDEIKMKHIKLLAKSKTSGSLFSEKYKNMKIFLDLKKFQDNKELIESLDSVWELRNKLSHMNHKSIDKFTFSYKGNNIELEEKSTPKEYSHFVINLCLLFDEALKNLKSFDQKALNKWGANDFLYIPN